MPNHFKSHSGPLNIWSAASSTGDEAHTLGVVCQSFKDVNAGFEYRILGTDISSAVVEKAEKGIYVGTPVKRFRERREELFNKYMYGNDKDGYKVIPSIKNNIKFKTHNLFNPLKSNYKFDLILLRNVLIYFTKKDQEHVLANIHNSLSPKGYLIIGESESLGRIDTQFEFVSPLIYRPCIAVRNKDSA